MIADATLEITPCTAEEWHVAIINMGGSQLHSTYCIQYCSVCMYKIVHNATTLGFIGSGGAIRQRIVYYVAAAKLTRR